MSLIPNAEVSAPWPDGPQDGCSRSRWYISDSPSSSPPWTSLRLLSISISLPSTPDRTSPSLAGTPQLGSWFCHSSDSSLASNLAQTRLHLHPHSHQTRLSHSQSLTVMESPMKNPCLTSPISPHRESELSWRIYWQGGARWTRPSSLSWCWVTNSSSLYQLSSNPYPYQHWDQTPSKCGTYSQGSQLSSHWSILTVEERYRGSFRHILSLCVSYQYCN